MCYRGVHLHLIGIRVRVKSNVMSFLGSQIICFLLFSLRPSVLAVIFLYAPGLRNPSAFFHILTALHTLPLTSYALHHTGVFILWVWLHAVSDCSRRYSVSHCLALRLLYALRLLLSCLPSINSSLLRLFMCLFAILVCLIDICSMCI